MTVVVAVASHDDEEDRGGQVEKHHSSSGILLSIAFSDSVSVVIDLLPAMVCWRAEDIFPVVNFDRFAVCFKVSADLASWTARDAFTSLTERRISKRVASFARSPEMEEEEEDPAGD